MITSNPPITGRNILISICQALIPQVILCKTIKSDSHSVYYLSIAHGSEHETKQIWVSIVPWWLASIHPFPVIASTALRVVGRGGTGIYPSWSWEKVESHLGHKSPIYHRATRERQTTLHTQPNGVNPWHCCEAAVLKWLLRFSGQIINSPFLQTPVVCI